jgi:hypothetical protein
MSVSAYDGTAEHFKLPKMADGVRSFHKIKPKAKYILFVWRLESPNTLIELLPEFAGKIAVVNGTITKSEDRETIRQKFMEDNDDLKIVICNPVVVGAGGDWDDLFGDRPRITFIIPHVRFIDVFQSAFRASRITSKSTTYTFIIYIKGIKAEMELFERLSARNGTLGSIRNQETEYPETMVDDCDPSIDPIFNELLVE